MQVVWRFREEWLCPDGSGDGIGVFGPGGQVINLALLGSGFGILDLKANPLVLADG